MSDLFINNDMNLQGGINLSKKVAIYCRVSTREQHLTNQSIFLKEYVVKSGWDYEIFEEKESTRKTRPVKYNLLQRLRRKEFDILLIWKLDRWARSMLELVNEITELQEKGIYFISYKDNIDLSTSAGRLQFNIICAFAQFERDLISERTKDGLERAKAEGKKLGRPKKSSQNRSK